jgi:hypothetical protein
LEKKNKILLVKNKKKVSVNMIMEFTPTLLWSQTFEDIEIEINLPCISSEIFRVENSTFHFECLSSNKKYLINFELEAEISGITISIQNDKKIAFLLKKKEEGNKWDFLAKKRGIYKNNIKINWDKWENSDDEEDVKNINMGGMGDMMGGMGGMGDMMGGMGGMGDMMGGMGGMDMSMLQEMMGNMGGEDDGEEGCEDQGEDDGEEGCEDQGEDDGEEGCEDQGEDLDEDQGEDQDE